MLEKKVFTAINTPLKDERTKFGLSITDDEATRAQMYNEKYEEGKKMF